jgi:isoleucyl-tRNA synthetase
MKKKFRNVSPQVNFVEQEKQYLKFWKGHDVFQKSLKKGDKTFSFYDGPPFATGLPHYGHLLAGVLKDVVPRYYTMNGYNVPRRFGWDCHGVPVEAEANKTLKLNSRQEVLDFGVDKYNEHCRSVVKKYTNEWKQTVERVGRWVDMDNPYHTMDVSFMESVWWVFKTLFDKGLVYEGFKVVPYSTGLSSVLSNFEANSNYKDVQDMTLTAEFKLKNLPYTLLAWTTTPWTLPSNLALAVNADLNYSVVSCNSKQYVVASTLVAEVFKNHTYTVEKELKGSELVDQPYEPLFSYFSNLPAFKVLAADYVSDKSGTGVVHLAPAFGEEDFNVCKKAGLPLVNPVNDDGLFTDEVSDFKGMKVTDSNKALAKFLKDKGLVFSQSTVLHSYPFCYRTQTPLIYRAVSSWFVNVEMLKEKLLKNNQTTNWVPSHLRDGRFGNWLENARDWAVSRNRFWGTPLPLWKNEEGEVVCVGSKEELERLTGEKVNDLHSHFVDHLTVPSPTGNSPLKKVSGVLDCWFESGAMPYAQGGYPNNSETFFKQFPADFVAEGLDQTRGWFYTLMVLGTALFDQAPFKNVVVNGLVLAEDGKKMSKMLKNYPDPNEVLDEHGADALRLYLLDSPVVNAQELKFSTKGVKDQVRKNLLRLHNVYSFFVNYANVDEFVPTGNVKSTNVLDQWLMSRLNRLCLEVNEEMRAYHLYNVVPKFAQFVEDLTNTYVRFNRVLFWKNGMPEDKRMAFETLHHVLLTLSKLLAPFAPFLSEELYQNLSLGDDCESVHLDSYPQGDAELVNLGLEESVQVMMDLTELGRNYRESVKLRNKVPLKSMTVAHRSQSVLDSLKTMEAFLMEELNVRSVNYTTDEKKYVQWEAKPNFSTLGKKLGPKLKVVTSALQALAATDLEVFLKAGQLELNGETLTSDDVLVKRKSLTNNNFVLYNNTVVLEFDPTVSEEQKQEGDFREVLRKVQETRKVANLHMLDRVKLEFQVTDEFKPVLLKFESELKLVTLANSVDYTDSPQGEHCNKVDLEGSTVCFSLTKV